MECDPIKPRTISCEGMKRFLAMPCITVQSESTIPVDETRCIDWRRAFQLAGVYEKKYAPYECRKEQSVIHSRVYAVFKWKTKTMYFFVWYMCADPWSPARLERCVYLYKAGFRWDDYTPWFPCASRVYPRMRDIMLTKDGLPEAVWPLPPDFRKVGLDAFAYSDDELINIGRWEGVLSYYDYERRICEAKYEHMGQTVKIKKTGEVGEVVDIGMPTRKHEWWDLKRPEAGETAIAGHRLKLHPLIYKIQLPYKWMPGDPWPRGMMVPPDVWFPTGWTPADPLPEGVTMDPDVAFPPGPTRLSTLRELEILS